MRLDAAERVLGGWTRTPPPAAAAPESAGEITAIRKAVAALDLDALEAWGGLNQAIARCAALEDDRPRPAPQGPAIVAGEDDLRSSSTLGRAACPDDRSYW